MINRAGWIRNGCHALALLAILSTPLLTGGCKQTGKTGDDKARPFAGRTIELFVGSASKPATEEAAALFEKQTGAKLVVHFGGSGQMLSQMRLSGRGDIYFPGSSDYMELAKREGDVIGETEKIIVYLIPAINVPRSNPKQIASLEDLAKPGVRVGIARPDAVCVGLYAAEVLEKAGLAAQIKPNIVTQAESCEKTAQLVALGSVDAVLGWEVFEHWQPDKIRTILLPAERVPRIGYIGQAVVVGVCVAKVDVTNEAHAFAGAKAAYTAHLASGETGAAAILWKEAGLGEKWAVVRIDGDMPPGTAVNQLWRWDGAAWTLLDPPTAFGQRLTCTDDGNGNKQLEWKDAQALAEIFTDDFNQKDGPLEKRWFNWNANPATVLDNSVRLAGWCEYLVNKCGYDAELALDGSYTHRMCFNNYYVEGGKNGVDDFYLYCRVNKVGVGDYPRGVQLRLSLDNATSTATCYLELCNDGPIKTIQQANVPWPTGWFNLRLEVRGNSFEGYINDTLYVSGVTRYGSGEADPVVPPDTGNEDWYAVYTGKFLGWGVVPCAAGQVEAADDYALFIYR